jgi:hypothetical protein
MSRSEADALRGDIVAYNQPEHTRTAGEEGKLDTRLKGIAQLESFAMVGFGVGVAGLLTGALLYANGDDPERFSTSVSAGTLGALPTEGGAAVTWSGRW